MHPMAARVEPTVDGQSVSLSDVHHGWIGRGLAGLQCRVRIVVDRSLFGLDGLPVIGRIALGSFFRFDERVRLTPPTPHFPIGTEKG